MPEPHPKQKQFLDSLTKRNVLVAGRRGGKTTLCAIVAVLKFLEGYRVLEAAPTADQTEAFWRAVKTFLDPLIASGLARKNETLRLIESDVLRASVRCKTAWNADTLRGDYADLLILDEYSIMNPSTWSEVGAPMLLDNDGIAMFIFTPKRRNHAFTLYSQALSDETGRWQAMHFTSRDNPYLSPEALAEIAQDMTTDAYRQEILAEFLADEGAVFRNLDTVLSLRPASPAEHDYADHDVVAGVDWGKHRDYTAISVFCSTCRRELALERYQRDYVTQLQYLRDIVKRWRVRHVLAEANAMGEPLLELLQQENLPISGFVTTATTKPPLIESLALACERAEALWLDDPVARLEMESYEYRASASGRTQYSAPPGMHDDTVIARALAWQAALQTGPLLWW